MRLLKRWSIVWLSTLCRLIKFEFVKSNPKKFEFIEPILRLYKEISYRNLNLCNLYLICKLSVCSIIKDKFVTYEYAASGTNKPTTRDKTHNMSKLDLSSLT